MSPRFITRHTHVVDQCQSTRASVYDNLTFGFRQQQLDGLDLIIGTNKSAKRRVGRRYGLRPFASVVSSSAATRERPAESIRTTFNKIDKDNKGHITEADLYQYAESHNLPKSYVKLFMEALLQQQQQQQHSWFGSSSSSKGWSSDGSDQDNEVSYSAFKSFVSSREQGLREAFKQFDLDGDGQISPDDLHVSLSRVAICNAKSRCVYRTRHQVVEQLLGQLNMSELQPLSFDQFRSYFMLLPQKEQLVEYWLSGPSASECCDLGGRFTILERKRPAGSPWGHLVAGAVSGAVSRTVTAPLETLKLAAMAGTLPANGSLLSAAQQMVTTGGVGALYRGNVVNVMRSAPARAVDFFAFDLLKSWLGADTPMKTFAAAGLAGTFSWALLYPLEVIRSRVTLDTSHRYLNLNHCINSIAKQEGPKAFYRGLTPSLAAIAPEAAITYGLHDILKRTYYKAYDEQPGIAASLLCGVIASWSGQLIAFPLETVSRRMQMAGAAAVAAAGVRPAAAAAGGGAAAAAAAAAAGGGMGQVMGSIMRDGGPAALYRGLGAATLRLVPSAIVSFGAYEVIRKVLIDLEAQQEVAMSRARHKQLHKVLSTAQKCNQHVQKLQAQGIEVPPEGTVCVGVDTAAAAECETCNLGSDRLVQQQQQGLRRVGQELHVVPLVDCIAPAGSSGSTDRRATSATKSADASTGHEGELPDKSEATPTGCELVAAAAAAAAAVGVPVTAAGVRAAAATPSKP